MSNIRKNLAVVTAGAMLVVGFGATGAVAGKMIGSNDIKKNAITSKHIAKGAVASSDLSKGVQKSIDAPADAVKVAAASLAAPKTIAMIGGSINTNNTNLNTSVTLPAGKYLITVDGSFFNTEGDLGADVYPQISVWLDKNNDGLFRWQDGEGDISPNALLPQAKDLHIAVSGNSVLTLTKTTKVGLIAHGYTSTKLDEGSGKIEIDKATITATKIG